MAFQRPANNTNTNSAPAAQGNGNFEKAVGFINIYLPSAGGGKARKIGAIALRASNAFEASVFKRLSEGDEAAQAAALQAMSNAVEFSFAEVVPADSPTNEVGF